LAIVGALGDFVPLAPGVGPIVRVVGPADGSIAPGCQRSWAAKGPGVGSARILRRSGAGPRQAKRAFVGTGRGRQRGARNPGAQWQARVESRQFPDAVPPP